MPEYLAPGVYVEEIEIGARPIEGVSTSTAGFIGYAERGPLNKPTLVTSFADFQRKFGTFLPAQKNGTDLSQIRWLAYAVSAFFENGGKRAYITRVANLEGETGASAASGVLPKLSDAGTPPTLAEKVLAEESAMKLAGTVNFTAGNALLLKDGAQSEFFEYKGLAKEIKLKGTDKLAQAYAAGTKIMKGDKPANASTEIANAVNSGDTKIPLKDVSKVDEQKYLLISDSTAGDEVVFIKSKTATEIVIQEPLQFDHAKDIEVFQLTTEKPTTLVKNAKKDDKKFFVDHATNLAADEFIIIGWEFHQIGAPANATDVYQVTPSFKYLHDTGKSVVKLEPAVKVEASSQGSWGNSIKIAVKQSSISKTKVTKSPENLPSDRLDVETINGIEPGTLLKLPATVNPQYGTVKEVFRTSTDTFIILSATFTGTVNKNDVIQTEEFNLIAFDGENEEVFTNLSLNDKHSRFIKKIVTEKSSNLIRIGDIVGTPPIILMPTPDELPGWLLTGGTDGFPADEMTLNSIYEGEDSDEPDNRTGLYTFKNIDEISIVAIPGITNKHLQQKLITHCEIDMKDRFAVLDPIPTADLEEIRAQRNLYDTSYAALYYPWLYAYDPLQREYTNIPPSGYVCGIYARTDVERGVYKAPANEKINGVVNLEKLNGKYRIVNKGTQEILNPIGINCIRIFPGRGIRVWGGRTVSSNSLWKYVNVRRLFLYLEESIEEGTQWVVFEPNDEKLWARVRQTISQFLTRVWRDGALMGTTAEEAFFVKCDRTTMMQDDIDNGRLIVLIGVAPVKPAEFVIFRIAQWTGGSEVTE